MTTTSNVGSISAWGFDLNQEATSSTSQTLEATNTSENREFDSDAGAQFDSLTIGAQFDSIEDAEEIFKKYAKSVGFSVRKDELHLDKSGKTTIRSCVCSNQGHMSQKYLDRTDRVREARGLTRNGCGAAFQVNYNYIEGKYMVTKFNNEHSHKLVAIYETQFLHSHRRVSDADFAHVHALRQVGVKVCQFMDYKSDQVGGFHNVGFMSKDLQNKLDKNLRVGCMDTDSEAVIAYLAAKADSDVGVYYEYTLDDANRLRNLFWTNMVAKYDYECFGDVLAFDATYKKNAYNKPLVVFVGINNQRTTIFGFALLTDEAVDSYTWLLQTFLNAMNNKKPKSVIIDGDKAMSKAIKTIMMGCSHRLCCWHLERNAQSKIKKEEFMKKFRLRHLMYSPLSIDEF